jgi:glycerol-3-phosphate dehydrogenase
VIGAGVVGCAVALALSRRGAAVALLEAEPAPARAASGTNSGILHTGFDSTPGELETELILASARLRDPVLRALGIPVLRCGGLMPGGAVLAPNARRNGVSVVARRDGALEIADEAITDPVAYTLALAAAAERHGAELLVDWRVAGIDVRADAMIVRAEGGDTVSCAAVVNCAGLYADAVARLAGDDSFEVYPRKGEFLVFDPPPGATLKRIMLPVPSRRTKGVLVFPTLDGKVIAGPSAIDQEDKDDWSVRPGAADEILGTAASLYPPLADATPIAAYAGLRPAGRGGVNYVIGRSRACPRLVNVAAIRSTGLTASLGIAQRVAEVVTSLGVSVGVERELEPGPAPAPAELWWWRAAELRAAT